jgi:hypothetical protein
MQQVQRLPAIISRAVETAANTAESTRNCIHPLSVLPDANSERALECRTEIPRNGLFM